MNKAAHNLVKTLIKEIDQTRDFWIKRITNAIAEGKMDEAERTHRRACNLSVRRPARVRVATMEAAIGYIIDNCPVADVKFEKCVRWQTNGNIDYYLRMTNAMPPIEEFMGINAMVYMLNNLSDIRNQAAESNEKVYEAYDEMVSCGKEATKHYTMFVHNPDNFNDKDRRRRLRSLVGQLHRDLRHIHISSTDEDWKYLMQTVQDIMRWLNPAEAHKISLLANQVSSVIETKKQVNALRMTISEQTDKLDKMEHNFRQRGTIVAV